VTQDDALGVLQTSVRENPDLLILDITMPAGGTLIAQDERSCAEGT
jgi:hypothetical protein